MYDMQNSVAGRDCDESLCHSIIAFCQEDLEIRITSDTWEA